ncbi:sigma 54-interacting transcriptional regulator [Cytobacillus oceanisediminis]|uniref:sigma 54-interacting transcriptional regulator n=1 Tax=Cytobacillus oceanisediminis TaxID=665099 RepID=UPI001FB1C64C|nr:sigma 54-interacting transcriptional regulator [Cytobacillus oceanisediminis]UOE53815.1 sigma 54-interacting transcriptional regulator [Cytobacillus oceanisediminis]
MRNEVVIYMKEVTRRFSFKKDSCLEPYQTEAVAVHFEIDRTRASRLLNELSKDGILLKINTRPVCFIHRETLEKQYGSLKHTVYDSLQSIEKELIPKPEEIFKKLIGYEKSLKESIEQVKTAIHYPSMGLPLLLLGPTGVGKTFFAKLIYDYSRTQNIIEDQAPFFVFNCAQYANNPELLSSYLFGHSKGAFTGALKDQVGLIEQANNGILFLDEVHRLNKEGQEKLFTFMDQGTFTRLGETNIVRKSKVRLVFATTESLSVFLETFLRRIPIKVNIPSLEDRGPDEKKQFIHHFFMEESKLLGIPIEVTNKTLDLLSKYHYSGNIGECKNTVKYACGFAFSKKSKTMDKIFVTLQDLPKHIFKNSSSLFNNYSTREGSVLFSPSSKQFFSHVNEMKITLIEQTYQNCLKYFLKFENNQFEESVFIEKCTDEITAMMDRLIFERPNESNNLMMEIILSTMQDIFRYLELNYYVKYDGNSVYTLSSYLFFKSNPFQLSKEEQLLSQRILQFIKDHYKMEYSIVSKVMLFIEKRMDVHLYFEDIIMMTLFLCKAKINHFHNRIKAMIIAHGYATASSIANVCNRLLGVNVFDSIDMPVDATVRDITEKMLQYMEEQDTSTGLVVLVDMGSLSLIHDHIKDKIDGPLLFVDQVSTPAALEIGNYVIQGRTIEEMVEPLKKSAKPSINLYYPTNGKEYAIVTSCFTGIGTATQIQQLLSESIGDLLDIKVIAHDFDRLKQNGMNEAPLRIYEVLAIVGTENPEIEEVNFISLEDIISGKGEGDVFRIFDKIADADTIRKVNDRIIMNFSLGRVIDSLTILDTEKIIRKVEYGINQLEKQIGKNLPNDKKIALFVHVSCMIERLIRKAPISEYPNLDEFLNNHTKEIKWIKSAFSVLEDNYSVQMTMAEIGYIYNIIKPNVPRNKELV